MMANTKQALGYYTWNLLYRHIIFNDLHKRVLIKSLRPKSDSSRQDPAVCSLQSSVNIVEETREDTVIYV